MDKQGIEPCLVRCKLTGLPLTYSSVSDSGIEPDESPYESDLLPELPEISVALSNCLSTFATLFLRKDSNLRISPLTAECLTAWLPKNVRDYRQET